MPRLGKRYIVIQQQVGWAYSDKGSRTVKTRRGNGGREAAIMCLCDVRLENEGEKMKKKKQKTRCEWGRRCRWDDEWCEPDDERREGKWEAK